MLWIRIASLRCVPLHISISPYTNPASKRRAANRATSPVSPLTVRFGKQATSTVRSWSSRVSYPSSHGTERPECYRTHSTPPLRVGLLRPHVPPAAAPLRGRCLPLRCRLRRPCSRLRLDNARGFPRRRVVLLCHTPLEVRGERRADARGAAARRSMGRADGRQGCEQAAA
jgi:hypothetical protein